MIIDNVFKEFVNVVKENNSYIIGLVNGDGLLTACSDESRVGDRLDVHQKDACNRFYPVRGKNFDYGYLWLNGNDANLPLMGNLISDSLNIRLTYEITQNDLRQNITNDDRLIKLLVDEEEFDMERILSLVQEMEFSQDKPRVSILLMNEKGFDNRKVAKIKLMPGGQEILCSMLTRYTLLIFKPVPENLDNIQLKKDVEKFFKILKNLDITSEYCLVGTVQTKLKNYRESYRHCLWLGDYGKGRKGSTAFFTDYIYEYYLSKIELNDVRNVFDYCMENSRGLDVDEMIRISDSLFENNFNISQTAENLFLHKNTLIYKLKKYEESFQIDIRGDFKGRFLFTLIASAFKDYRKRRQVGEGL